MIDNIRNLVKRNGTGTNGHGASGSGLNGQRTRLPGTYCYTSDSRNEDPLESTHPSIEVPIIDEDQYEWTLEVRRDQSLLGSMHSQNPFALISLFRQYTVFHGDPSPPYAVWLRHRESNRGAPMTTLFGEEVWLEFLRALDPEIDDHLSDSGATTERTGMFNENGRPTNPDSVFEQAFGAA